MCLIVALLQSKHMKTKRCIAPIEILLDRNFNMNIDSMATIARTDFHNGILFHQVGLSYDDWFVTQ